MPDTNHPEYSAQAPDALFPLTESEVSGASSSYYSASSSSGAASSMPISEYDAPPVDDWYSRLRLYFPFYLPQKKSVKTDEEWKQIYLDEMSCTLKIIKCDLTRETLFKVLSADQIPITVLPELQQTRILEAMVSALGGFISKESQSLKWMKAIKLAILLHHSLPKDLARVFYDFARQQFTYLKEAHWALICSQPLSADAMEPIPHHLPLLAVYCNDVSVIARLHDLKVNAHALNSAVTVAVDLGLYAALNQLIIHGFDVNQQSVLCRASERGHTNIVELLIEKGADVNQMCACTGATPLYIAAKNGHTDVVKVLIANKAVVDQTCTDAGLRPLYIAAQNGHTEVVEVLLANQANVDIICKDYGYGGTALYIAAKKGRTKVVEVLLANHADVNPIRSRDGATALYIAAEKGHTEIVELLIRSGADVNQTLNGNYNRSPLHIAARNGHTKIVELLLANNANVNQAIRFDGSAALFFAALSDHTKIVELLIRSGANVNQTLNVDCNYSPLHIAAQYGHTKVVELLLAYDADVNQVLRSDGATALYNAVQNGHIDIVNLLIRSGANVNQMVKGNCNYSPLYIAAQKGYTKIVELLLANGANFNHCINENGSTVLDAAVESGHLDIVELLLAAQANFIMPEGSGVTKEEEEEFRRGLFQRWQQKRGPGFFSSISTSAVIDPDENSALSSLPVPEG